MARTPHEGTPRESRAKAYIYPPRKRTVLWGSIVAGVALIAALVGGYAAGAKRTLSPGDVASHHARIDLKCAQCHDAGQQVEALRCERCHDPSGSERLSHAAHVLLGSGDTRKAEMAEMTACATCHTEHKGLSASLRQVDDRECATCHKEFPSFARHAEFAAVRAKATAGIGLRFNHDFHIQEVRRVKGATCQACHIPTADKRAFEPIKFELHCGAACHPFTETDPVQSEVLLPPMAGRTQPVSAAAFLPEPFRSATSAKLTVDGRDVVASGLKHRDGWVLFNALRIRGSMDFDGEAAERLTLRARIAYLQQLQTVKPVYEARAEELQAAATQLQTQIADVDATLAQTAASDLDAIRETLMSSQTIAKIVGATSPAVKAAADAIANSTLDAKPVTTAPDKEAQARFDRRKAELVRTLDVIAVRAADEGVKQRAAALKADVQKLTAPAATNDADAAALLDRLTSLDDVFATVRTIPDPGVLAEVSQIDLLRSYGQQGVGMGLSADDFEVRRTELLSLLTNIEQRGSDTIRQRIAPLRQRVLAVRPGSTGDRELQRTRRGLQKQLDRVRLELELMGSADNEAPRAQNDSVDQAAIQTTLADLQRQLAEIERSPRMSPVDTPEERESRKNDLDALLGRCLKCHEYDSSGVRLAQVRAAEPVMPRSIFNHAPHTTQTQCETCHDPTPSKVEAAKAGKCKPGERPLEALTFGVSWSQCATDVNAPGVANCQMCHKPSQAKAECETCHVYHPNSPARLLAVTR